MSITGLEEFKAEVSKVLNIPASEWNNRHFIPSSKSGYILNDSLLMRKSVIRDLGPFVVAKTMLTVEGSYTRPIYYKRFWDALFDWEAIDMLHVRNAHLKNIAIVNDKPLIADIIDNQDDRCILHPEDLKGYDDLEPTDRMFFNTMVIYSFLPSSDLLVEDMTIVSNVGKSRAEKALEAGIFNYEDLIKDSKFSVFYFRPNRNHVAAFNTIFKAAHMTIFDKKIEVPKMTVAGSFGRGNSHGHDIDLLFHERDRMYVNEVMKSISYKIMSNSSNTMSFNVVLLDTFVRMDISYYNDCNKLTYMFHYFGPKDMNIMMRSHAKKRGYSLSQDGLKDISSQVIIHPKTDTELFQYMDLLTDPRDKYWNGTINRNHIYIK